MGRTHWFECGKCGYRARVSGRADRGLNFFVQTIVCRDCRQLYDAITRIRLPDPLRAPNPRSLGVQANGNARPAKVPLLQPRFPLTTPPPPLPPTFQAMLNRLPYRGIRYFKWINYRPQCPIAAWHRVSEWTEPGKCPRCGLHMERNAIPYRIWE